MPDFRRGIEAIQEAQASSKGGGDFKPWVPQILWQDKDEKYILVLNTIDEIPLVDLHEWIPVGEQEKADGTKFTKYEWFIDRTDPSIGEDEDPLTEKGSVTKQKNLAVAVELEPIMATVKGRPRPKGFEVKTTEFERTVRDDEGEATDEKETITTPVIGIINQSPHNFFGYLASFNESEGPIEETPFKVLRRGGSTNTAYDFTPYFDQEVDLTNVVEFVDGITYLNDQMDEIVKDIDDLEPADAARVIATYLLDTRLEELADGERYEELTSGIEEIKPKFGGKDKKKAGKATSEKPKRTSQRTKAKSNSKAKATTKPSSEEPGEEVKSQEDPGKMDKFEELRVKAAKRREAAAAAA